MNNFITSLDFQDLLMVSGEDSEKFLQGQLTCDLEQLADGQCALGAACNTKGRVYSSFRLLKQGQDFYLVMQPGMLDITIKTLEKYMPFYKAVMSDAGAKYLRTGIAGTVAEEKLRELVADLPEPNVSINVDGEILLNLGGKIPRYEIWSEKKDSPLLLAFDSLKTNEIADWQALDCDAGLFFVSPEDSEKYTPEETNMDLAGFVSFDKGCYTGQEIVARMHFRGKAGKRMFIARLESALKIDNFDLKDSSSKALGTLFNILYLKDNKVISFVVLKADASLEETLLLDAGDKSLSVKISSPVYT